MTTDGPANLVKQLLIHITAGNSRPEAIMLIRRKMNIFPVDVRANADTALLRDHLYGEDLLLPIPEYGYVEFFCFHSPNLPDLYRENNDLNGE